MNASSKINRRTMLKGLGVSLALPWLESVNVFGSSAMAQGASGGAAVAGVAQEAATGFATGGAPLRMAALFMPNGVNTRHWDASGEGDAMTLSDTLSPMENVKRDILVLKGLHNRNAEGGDGHYAKTANLLSGETVRKTKGRDLHVGVSMDQLMAQQFAGQTPLNSLVLATEPTRGGVDTNVGFTQIYGGHISWSSPTTPVPKEIYPRQAFDRLFRDAAARQSDRSILDAVLDDARRLEQNVSASDRQKLGEYFESIRAVEHRIDSLEQEGAQQWTPDTVVDPDDLSRPAPGLPEDATEHYRLMLDLIVLAFQMNKTRVATLMFGNSVSGRNMSFLDGVSGGHHHMSHHENSEDKLRQYQLINKYFIEQLAYVTQRMKAIPEGDGTLLDHTMLLFGSGLSDGNSHNFRNLPVVLAGGRGAGLRTGRAVDCGENNRLCALHLSLLHRMGVGVERFGDAEVPLALS
ncbi:MAG: DUF1552 domain-containing protein [Phycisphaerales bacterium JB063]